MGHILWSGAIRKPVVPDQPVASDPSVATDPSDAADHGGAVWRTAARRWILGWLLASLTWTNSGCLTRQQSIVTDGRAAFLRGDLDLAEEQWSARRGRGKRWRDLERVDRGMIALLQGDGQTAETLWREARDHFEHLQQQSGAESLASLATDDRQLAYAGEEYERVLLRSFLSLASLMQDGQDALAYAQQALQTEKQILQRVEVAKPDRATPEAAGDESGTSPPTKIERAGPTVIDSASPSLANGPADQPIAPPTPIGWSSLNGPASCWEIGFAHYLCGAMLEATHRRYDDAQRAYANVLRASPSMRQAGIDLQRASVGVHSAQGHGALYVIALVGPGPIKQEVTAPVTSEALMIANVILDAIQDKPPTLLTAPVKVPAVVVPPSPVQHVGVSVAGQAVGWTETVTDVGAIAVQQSQTKLPQTIARAVVRRSLKKAAVYGVREQLAGDQTWVSIAFDAANFLWEATEAADTRGWSTLPGTIQVLRVELPAGEYPLALQPMAGSRGLAPATTETCRIQDGGNTYAVVCFPTAQRVGKLLVSP